jgi:MFS family permease
MIKGRIYLMKNDGASAVSEFRAIVYSNPELVEGHLLLAQAHVASGQTGLAADVLLNAMKAYPDTMELIQALSQFYLLQGRGFSPSQAGLILTAQPLVMAIAAPISGTLSDRIGSRVLSTAGMAIMTIGLILLSRLGPATPTGTILGSLAVFGLGTGVFISPNTNALMGSAPRNRQGIAAGILATARNSGMVLGVGMAGAVFTSILSMSAPTDAAGSLFHAISVSFLFSACLAGLGILVSALRGKSPLPPGN